MNYKVLLHLDSELPKHIDISKKIKFLILEDRLKAGEKLPTEEALAVEIGVSKAVTRQSYRMLIKDGWLKRVPKLGVIVQSKKSSQSFSTKLQSIGEDMLELGIVPDIILMGFTLLNNRIEKISYFSQDEKLFKLDRIITGDGLPLLFMHSFYSLDRFPGIEDLDLNQASIFEYFQKDLHIKLVKTIRTMHPQMMPKYYAEKLQVSTDTPCIQAESITYDDQEICIEYGISYGVGDRFSISI